MTQERECERIADNRSFRRALLSNAVCVAVVFAWASVLPIAFHIVSGQRIVAFDDVPATLGMAIRQPCTCVDGAAGADRPDDCQTLVNQAFRVDPATRGNADSSTRWVPIQPIQQRDVARRGMALCKLSLGGNARHLHRVSAHAMVSETSSQPA